MFWCSALVFNDSDDSLDFIARQLFFLGQAFLSDILEGSVDCKGSTINETPTIQQLVGSRRQSPAPLPLLDQRSAKLSSTNNSRSTAHGYAVKHALSAMPKDPAESETAATWQHHSVLVKLKSFTSMPNFFTNNRNCNRCRTQPPSLPSSNARFITLRCMASFARANLERFHPPPSDSPCPVQPPRL